MDEKKPRTIITQPVPAKFGPMLDAEQERMGCYTRVDCMGKILEQYFAGKDQPPQEQPKKKEYDVF